MIKEEWENFKEIVISKNAPKIQFKEMERAFYAGAMMMFSIIIKNSDEENEDTAVLNLEKIYGELLESKDKWNK